MGAEVDEKKVITLSSPGKILMAGGYLVLESPNIGIVVAADKRFYSTVVSLSEPSPLSPEDEVASTSDKDASSFGKASVVDVHSPQYDTIFSYYLLYNDDAIENDDAPLVKLITRNKSQTSNSFIERTLILAFSYILISSSKSSSSELLPPVIGIKLRADNDFYSQVSTLKSLNLSPPTPKDVESLPPFLPAGEHKTGMGSSAALVTSLIASLLHFFSTNCTDSNSIDEEQQKIIYNLAQTAHSLAQGKIGSGFDVSAAVYGSQIYSRFSQSIIQPLLQEFSTTSSASEDENILTKQFSDLLYSTCVHEKWDSIQNAFSLPDGFDIIMADVCGGSESPSMARKVLQWHKSYQKKTKSEDDEDNDDDDYWEGLKNINKELYDLFSELHKQMNTMDPQQKQDILHLLSQTKAEHWEDETSSELSKQIVMIREAFLESRSNLKAMGEAANVPIEPDGQTELADATMEIPGVIAAGVPGAGGVDALFCLYIKGENTEKSDSVRDSIAKLWGEWNRDDNEDESVVSPMGVRAVGWGEGLQVEQEMLW